VPSEEIQVFPFDIQPIWAEYGIQKWPAPNESR